MSEKDTLIAAGFSNVESLIEAASRVGLPLYIAAALIEKESHGKNIYGHDNGGVFSVPNQNIEVNETNFREFIQRINAGELSNGVGPCQITWKGFFPDAEKKGLKLWIPLDNFIYGFTLLKSYLPDYSDTSIQKAGTRYNGRETYGTDFLNKTRVWKSRLENKETKLSFTLYEHLNSPLQGPTLDKEFIAIHWYGLPGQTGDVHQTAKYLSTASHASVNYVAADGVVYCLVSDNVVAYGQGDGANGYGNLRGISIECNPHCTPGDRETVAQLIAKIRRDGGKNYPLRPHNHFTATQCPGVWEQWLSWLSNRANEINGAPKPAPAPAPKPAPAPVVGTFTVKINTAVLNVRTGPGVGHTVATSVKAGEVFTIVETSGVWGKLKSGAGWISLDYTVRVGAPAAPAPAPVNNDFKVKVGTSVLNIRAGAGTNHGITGTITDWGVYTIVATNGSWGKLKSGAGWIHLDYTDRV